MIKLKAEGYSGIRMWSLELPVPSRNSITVPDLGDVDCSATSHSGTPILPQWTTLYRHHQTNNRLWRGVFL